MSQTEKYQIKEESSLHKYRTEIPNIIDNLNLTGNEFKLYFKYKRIAGDNGSCWKSLKTLSEETGLSIKTIKECNKTLIVPREELGGLSLINLQHRFKEDGGKDSSCITIVDIWPINMTYFSKTGGGGVKFTHGVGQNLPEGGVKFTHKEEPFKKNTVCTVSAAEATEEKSEEKIIFPGKGKAVIAIKEKDLWFKLQGYGCYTKSEISEAIAKVKNMKKRPALSTTIEKYLTGIILKTRKQDEIDKAICHKKRKEKKASPFDLPENNGVAEPQTRLTPEQIKDIFYPKEQK